MKKTLLIVALMVSYLANAQITPLKTFVEGIGGLMPFNSKHYFLADDGIVGENFG